MYMQIYCGKNFYLPTYTAWLRLRMCVPVFQFYVTSLKIF